MTSPANGIPRPSISTARPPSGVSISTPAAAKPDHRTTALQSAVAILRGSSPKPKIDEVVEMAEAFHAFLKKG